MAFHNISFVEPEVKVSNTSEWMNEYQVIDKFHSTICMLVGTSYGYLRNDTLDT